MAVPAIISQQFPNKNEVYQGYAVMALGMGLTIGPVFGSIVFSFFSYSASMIVFSVIVFSVGIYGVILIPENLNQEYQKSSCADMDENDEDDQLT